MRRFIARGRKAGPISLPALFMLSAIVMTASAGPASEQLLVGGDGGLFLLSPGVDGYKAECLWPKAKVVKIERADTGWYVLSSGGLLYLEDSARLRDISGGLPVKTLNHYRDGSFAPVLLPEMLKDIESDPYSPRRALACTAETVLYSPDRGSTWTDLGSPSVMPGLKAVSFAPWPGTNEDAVWVSHAVRGVFARKLASGSTWTAFSAGLPKVFGPNIEEVSDMALVPAKTGKGNSELKGATLVAGLSFLGRMYRWDDALSKWEILYADAESFGTVESLEYADGSGIRFLDRSGPRLLKAPTDAASPAGAANGRIAGRPVSDTTADTFIRAASAAISGNVNCLTVPSHGLTLSELWLSGSPKPGESVATLKDSAADARRARARGKNGLYLQTGFVVNSESKAKYFALAKQRGLDCIVVDLKDDYGRLRFNPDSELLSRLGQVSSPMDVESFVAEAKAADIYLIGRVVVFKDETLYKAENGRLAVRDAGTGAPWRGYRTANAPAAPVVPAPPPAANGTANGTANAAAKAQAKIRTPIAEYWVDPYSTEVWEYNVEIAREITARGFDEVQFDYIRFPTDGENLDAARYPAKPAGMDRESALESFLAYARIRVDAPISIDIYGANGWYRSGLSTGQDVEMLSNYVDIVCPMLYPSHFEQDFLAEAPPELRPYRIYRTGTLRNRHIARDSVLVRPYVQAFYLDVSYDRIWYDKSYVQREVDGVYWGANEGLTFWNNSGRYDDLP